MGPIKMDDADLNGVQEENGVLHLSNPHLHPEDDDILFHFGLSKRANDLPLLFGGVKFVFTGGSVHRIQRLAEEVALQLDIEDGSQHRMLSNTDRYVLYRVGPVLCVNHGIGCPSIAIMLIEVLKLLRYAGCERPVFFRLGTCGGLGLEPGTVVVSSGVLNGELKPYQVQYIFGRRVERPVNIDQQLVSDLLAHSQPLAFPVVTGVTMCADDFYEGQGRLDGAFCDYTTEDKMQFLHKLNQLGVSNVEMESVCFAATLARAGVKGAIVCVTLLNRLLGDQVLATKADLTEWERRPLLLVMQFVKEQLLTGNC